MPLITMTISIYNLPKTTSYYKNKNYSNKFKLFSNFYFTIANISTNIIINLFLINYCIILLKTLMENQVISNFHKL